MAVAEEEEEDEEDDVGTSGLQDSASKSFTAAFPVQLCIHSRN